ncbi:MAG: RNA polymerase sigma factor [Cyclobacteriaceae bacterium]
MSKSPKMVLIEYLVLNSQMGDAKSLNLLVKRWHPKILGQAFRQTHDRDAAADVAQESWRSIIKGIYKLKDPALFPAWAYQIVNRRAADWIRKIQKDRKIQSIPKEELNEQSDEESDKVDILRRALNGLPVDQQTILNLFYMEKMSVNQIAKAMEVPSGTIKSRLYYAREHLKKIFKQHDYEKEL